MSHYSVASSPTAQTSQAKLHKGIPKSYKVLRCTTMGCKVSNGLALAAGSCQKLSSIKHIHWRTPSLESSWSTKGQQPSWLRLKRLKAEYLRTAAYPTPRRQSSLRFLSEPVHASTVPHRADLRHAQTKDLPGPARNCHRPSAASSVATVTDTVVFPVPPLRLEKTTVTVI